MSLIDKIFPLKIFWNITVLTSLTFLQKRATDLMTKQSQKQTVYFHKHSVPSRCIFFNTLQYFCLFWNFFVGIYTAKCFKISNKKLTAKYLISYALDFKLEINFTWRIISGRNALQYTESASVDLHISFPVLSIPHLLNWETHHSANWCSYLHQTATYQARRRGQQFVPGC
jgi:hypothetical protein